MKYHKTIFHALNQLLFETCEYRHKISDEKTRYELPKCLRLWLPQLLQNYFKYAPCFLLRVSMLLQGFFELLLISFDFFNRFLQAVNSWIRSHWSLSLIFCLLGLICSFLQSFCLICFNLCFLSQHKIFCFVSFCSFNFFSFKHALLNFCLILQEFNFLSCFQGSLFFFSSLSSRQSCCYLKFVLNSSFSSCKNFSLLC